MGTDSELEMCRKRFRIFGKYWLVDDSKRVKLLRWLREHNEEYLCLDTTTFTEDGCLSIEGDWLPSVAERLSFSNSNSDITVISLATTIGDYFLSNCSKITSVNLSCFSNVTTIGDFFLYSCSQITSVDLSCFGNVTAVGDFFLRN